MVKYNFQKVVLRGQKSGKCGCDKKRVRSKTFWQTLSPFNVNKEGKNKSRREILVELEVEREAWTKEPITCEDCET